DAPRTIDSLLRSAATVTGRGQIANLPIVPIGFSGGGNDAFTVASSLPSRVITYVANRIAPSPRSDAQPGWTDLPGLLLPGNLDSNQKPSDVYGAGFKGVATYYGLNTSIREKGGLAAMGVMLGQGHSNDASASPASPGYEFAWYWTARTAAARLPGTVASSTPGNPIALNPLSKTSGWLADTDRYGLPGNTTPNGTSPFKTIAAHANYTGDKETASWLVDQDLAFAFRAAMSNDSNPTGAGRWPGPEGTPLMFTGLTGLQSLSQGALANLAINPRDFVTSGTSITRMDFYDGATFLGSDTLASDGWGITAAMTDSGIRGLSVIATRSDGQVRTSFRAISVQAVPEPSAFAVLCLAAGGLLRRKR
ncbi:MAG TPA: PEP-CTERM sorting domain-containing protein, partial [Tepidisphaeraceae bacterium]